MTPDTATEPAAVTPDPAVVDGSSWRVGTRGGAGEVAPSPASIPDRVETFESLGSAARRFLADAARKALADAEP